MSSNRYSVVLDSTAPAWGARLQTDLNRVLTEVGRDVGNAAEAAAAAAVVTAPSAVSAYANTGQSIPTGSSDTILDFITETQDTNGEWSADTYTAQRAGNVFVAGAASWSTTSGFADETVHAAVLLDGTEVTAAYETAWSSTAGSVVFCAQVAVDVGTTIQIGFRHDGPSSRDLLSGPATHINLFQS